jgi:hypothetical protein
MLGGKIAPNARIRYSAEGKRALCTRPVGGLPPDNPDRIGVYLGMVTAKVARIMWDDRRSVGYMHIDYIESLSASSSQATPADADTATDAAAPVSVASLSNTATPAPSRALAATAGNAETPSAPGRSNSVAP